jgi:hypothetical protein
MWRRRVFAAAQALLVVVIAMIGVAPAAVLAAEFQLPAPQLPAGTNSVVVSGNLPVMVHNNQLTSQTTTDQKLVAALSIPFMFYEKEDGRDLIYTQQPQGVTPGVEYFTTFYPVTAGTIGDTRYRVIRHADGSTISESISASAGKATQLGSAFSRMNAVGISISFPPSISVGKEWGVNAGVRKIANGEGAIGETPVVTVGSLMDAGYKSALPLVPFGTPQSNGLPRYGTFCNVGGPASLKAELLGGKLDFRLSGAYTLNAGYAYDFFVRMAPTPYRVITPWYISYGLQPGKAPINGVFDGARLTSTTPIATFQPELVGGDVVFHSGLSVGPTTGSTLWDPTGKPGKISPNAWISFAGVMAFPDGTRCTRDSPYLMLANMLAAPAKAPAGPAAAQAGQTATLDVVRDALVGAGLAGFVGLAIVSSVRDRRKKSPATPPE